MAGPASAAPSRVKVPNAQPALGHAVARGKANSKQAIDVRLYLAARNSGAMMDAVRAVSTPGSSNYGKYMSPEQFRAQYAPSGQAVSTVKNFLAASGLKVTAIPANAFYVEARGSVAAMQKAFGTTLQNYQLGGRDVRAASVAPTIPSQLSGTVIAVSGLASESQLMKPAAPPPDAFKNAPPCSAYYGEKVATTLPAAYGKKQPYVPCGYVPSQLQGTYGITGAIAHGLDGRGVRVAITDAYAAPTIVKDANIYATRHGQKAFAAGQFTQVTPAYPYLYGYYDKVNGDQCGEQGWYGEETLDVEAVHAVAPGANISYVASRSCDNGDFADTINRVVDEHLADIVTNSWGGTDESNGSPALDEAYARVFAQAALEGIGFYFSSGDSGDGSTANNGTPTVEAPANSPLVTAVGGTSLAVGASNQRLWETGWSTGRSVLTDDGTAWDPAPPGNFQYGAGGGTSRVFPEPWYQKRAVPSDLATRWSATPARVVPDVSAVGDPNTGMLIGETQSFPTGTPRYSEYRLGGTSLASPLFAGIMALADQAAGHPHGFANPALYRQYGSSAFYDPKPVTGRAVARVDYANSVNADDGLVYSLRSIDVTVGTILRTRTGYDDITGIGSANGLAFLKALS